ncbi:MAG TPA: hypothetical protein VEA41_21485 [Salinarimonas sp.]|nr:hypothetical protein [Salinarimonas sp.]
MTLLLPKARIIRDQDWLDHLKTERCILTGLYGNDYEGIDPAHIGTLGRGIKSSDDEVLPILHKFHALQPSMGEMTMWRTHLPDDVLRDALKALAREMYAKWKERTNGMR